MLIWWLPRNIHRDSKGIVAGARYSLFKYLDPLGMFLRGSRYLIVKELGLKDHIYHGFWDLNPQ